MHFLLTVLLTASYPFSVYLATILPQVPLDVGVMGTTPYGFERLGFYYVINQKTKYALSANGSDPGQGVVAILRNKGLPNVLDLSRGESKSGAPVLTYPQNKPSTSN
ncbi:MAG: hypothetical protein L6R41_007065 [Letrouitia leprolyta]|nr:MAG: hypothetical protein L6R41_007065 [Letrouitia leprolyta]